MEIIGTITEVLEERTGVSKVTGEPWRLASYVMTTTGNYPHKVMFEVMDGTSGRIERLGIKKGLKMRVWIDIDAREVNGRWWNTLRAYDARVMEESMPSGVTVTDGGKTAILDEHAADGLL